MTRLLRSGGVALTALLLVLGAIFTSHQAPSAAQATQAARPEHVILISVDGLPPDYYTASEKLGLRVPTLTMLKQGGAYAEGMEGVYPTVTYPQHATMVTGVRPAAHGIVQNRIFEAPSEPQTRYWYWYAKALKAETLWTVAKKAGLTAAAIGWPVTVGAEIDYNVPEIYEPGENPPTWKWTARHSTPGLLEKALGPDLKKDSSVDERLTSVGEFIIKNYRPSLLLLHLIELDGVHHRNGPRTRPGIETAEREDGYIGRIVEATRQAGIFEKTTFFIVSDHGFAGIDKRFSPNVALAKEGLITLDAKGKATAWKAAAWPAGGSCAIVLKDANDRETEAKVNALFSKWARQERSPVRQIVTRAELHRLQAVPEAALMLEAAPGFSFDDTLTGPEVRDSDETYKGTHGYLPTDPRMRASLIVYGPGVRSGAKLQLARMIDLAPSIAGLLRLKLPHPEGKPFRELLDDGAMK
ncbi:MAG TPA: ectonucleotide pyrophosphatase/phosphodiesterase [Blastocatellia bacterium]|nr:ectonucleotide pyrophosphatase/phosphodiesterase [Blastocatellia bacterium]